MAEGIKLPAGYSLVWSGQYEYMEQAKERFMVIIPLTVLIIFVIIYINTKSVIKTAIVFLAVPFSLVGAFWLLYFLDYHTSVAVWVGIIALAGLDAETGVVMLLYLDLAHKQWSDNGRMNNHGDLRQAIHHGAVKRIRPKVMTICVIIAGLLPIMWSHGAGADVMKRIAAPMVGGVVTRLTRVRMRLLRCSINDRSLRSLNFASRLGWSTVPWSVARTWRSRLESSPNSTFGTTISPLSERSPFQVPR